MGIFTASKKTLSEIIKGSKNEERRERREKSDYEDKFEGTSSIVTFVHAFEGDRLHTTCTYFYSPFKKKKTRKKKFRETAACFYREKKAQCAFFM